MSNQSASDNNHIQRKKGITIMKKSIKNASIVATTIVSIGIWYTVCYFIGTVVGSGLGKFIVKNWEK